MVDRINSHEMLSDLHMDTCYLSHSTFLKEKNIPRENSVGVGPTKQVTQSPQIQHTVSSHAFVSQDTGASSIFLE